MARFSSTNTTKGRSRSRSIDPAVQIRPFAKIGDTGRGRCSARRRISLSRRVSLTGGVRYTDEQKDLDEHRRDVPAWDGNLADPASFYDYVDSATYQAWTPKGSIQVQVSRDTFVYVSATRGFKSGGFNHSPHRARPGPSTPSSPGVLKVA